MYTVMERKSLVDFCDLEESFVAHLLEPGEEERRVSRLLHNNHFGEADGFPLRARIVTL